MPAVSVLYISYTGLLDPLGQSQVLQYVLGLSKSYRMTLLTFEKPELLQNSREIKAIERQCNEAGVDWHFLIYHRRPNIPASLYDVMMGIYKGVSLVRNANAQIVHCRSYLSSVMGLAIKRVTGVRHIFDMRGFWADERVDGGIWKKESLKYRLFKRLERALFLNTDHVVSLTRAGEHEIRKFGYLSQSMPPISVIPTCTNLDIFYPVNNSRNKKSGFTLGYVGSAGSWYMFEDVSRMVKLLFDRHEDARFLVINKGGHSEIQTQLSEAGVDLSRVEIKSVSFDEVSGEIGRMDAGVFFIKPVWSKIASCPTRMGEFLACGKPCLANTGVGDVEEDFTDTKTGVTIKEMGQEALGNAISGLVALSVEPGISDKCRTVAKERFSLEAGVDKYADIYASVSGTIDHAGNL